MSTKLIIGIVQEEDSDQLIEALREEDFACTKISSTGGFLRRGNVTLMIGVDEERVSAALHIITRTCHTRTHFALPYLWLEPEDYIIEPVEVQVGGAVVFVLDVERMVRV